MERPSHNIATLSLQPASRAFGGFGLAVLAQSLLAAVLIGGFVERVAQTTPQSLEVAQIDKVRSETPPPPPVKFEKPVMPTAVEPVITIAPEGPGPTITVVPAQPPQQNPIVVAVRPPPQVAPTVPDSAAVAIAGTHTAPPYPAMARRLGAQGKVTLRLTVMPDGSVGKAEVVGSSGRQDLDQAATGWVTGHWTYRPATHNGAPAPAQVMAAVQFNLADAQ